MFENFQPRSIYGLQYWDFFSHVGPLSVQSYANGTLYADYRSSYLIEITSYYPGALSFAGLLQPLMQRILKRTIFRTCVTIPEALNYSDSTLDEFSLCQLITRNVTHRLNTETDFEHPFQKAKYKLSMMSAETPRSSWKEDGPRVSQKARNARMEAPKCAERIHTKPNLHRC